MVMPLLGGQADHHDCGAWPLQVSAPACSAEDSWQGLVALPAAIYIIDLLAMPAGGEQAEEQLGAQLAALLEDGGVTKVLHEDVEVSDTDLQFLHASCGVEEGAGAICLPVLSQQLLTAK